MVVQTVHSRFDHYKTEHIKVLKEATVLLELSLWKSRLDDDNEGGGDSLEAPTKKVKIDVECTRTGIQMVDTHDGRVSDQIKHRIIDLHKNIYSG